MTIHKFKATGTKSTPERIAAMAEVFASDPQAHVDAEGAGGWRLGKEICDRAWALNNAEGRRLSKDEAIVEFIRRAGQARESDDYMLVEAYKRDYLIEMNYPGARS